MNMKYIIVGAGISGLSIGQVLKEYGHDVQLFEADSRPGGMVKCDRSAWTFVSSHWRTCL